MPENSTKAVAGQIKARDDEGDYFTFEITEGNAQDLFDIGLTTGVVSMKNGAEPFDYEEWVSNNKPEYKIKVEVLDVLATSFSTLLGNVGTFTIEIRDVNEKPYFDYSSKDNIEISIPENTRSVT